MTTFMRRTSDGNSILPSFESYGQYKSENYGAHSLLFSIGDVDVYFSYRTPVAFRTRTQDLVVRENSWGPTTGKHLNWIDGGEKEEKAKRVSGETFERMLSEAV